MDAMWIQTWAILVSILGLVILGFFFGNRRLDDLRTDMNTHLAAIGGRFDGVNARFATVDGRFSAIENRLMAIDGRLAGIDGRLGGVEGRLGGIEGRLVNVDEQLRDLRGLLLEALRPRTT